MKTEISISQVVRLTRRMFMLLRRSLAVVRNTTQAKTFPTVKMITSRRPLNEMKNSLSDFYQFAAVKPMGLNSQAHSGGQSQSHAPVTTGTSRPSSPGTSSHLATVAVSSSLHQPAVEHKSGEMREARPGLMTDLARRGASPTVQSVTTAHPPASVGNKVISIVPSAPLSQSHQVPKQSVPTVSSHHPISAHGSGPVTGAGTSVSSAISHMPSAAVGMSGHSQPSKMVPSNTVSVTPAVLTTTARIYTPPHMAFTAPRQPPISSSESTMVCTIFYSRQKLV